MTIDGTPWPVQLPKQNSKCAGCFRGDRAEIVSVGSLLTSEEFACQTGTMKWQSRLMDHALIVAVSLGTVPAEGLAQTANIMDRKAFVMVRGHTCRYPPRAIKKRAEGTVVIQFEIGADGTVRDTDVQQSSGDLTLDHSAVSCVERWRYVPARTNGQPIAIHWAAKIAYRFTPPDPPQAVVAEIP